MDMLYNMSKCMLMLYLISILTSSASFQQPKGTLSQIEVMQ